MGRLLPTQVVFRCGAVHGRVEGDSVRDQCFKFRLWFHGEICQTLYPLVRT